VALCRGWLRVKRVIMSSACRGWSMGTCVRGGGGGGPGPPTSPGAHGGWPHPPPPPRAPQLTGSARAVGHSAVEKKDSNPNPAPSLPLQAASRRRRRPRPPSPPPSAHHVSRLEDADKAEGAHRLDAARLGAAHHPRLLGGQGPLGGAVPGQHVHPLLVAHVAAVNRGVGGCKKGVGQ
jgi:hypothetical protein